MAKKKHKDKKNSNKKTKKENKAAKKDSRKKTKKSKKEHAAKVKSAAFKSTPVIISSEQRLAMIRTAAYYLGQKRGYMGGSELDDWVRAEREIDNLIRQTKG